MFCKARNDQFSKCALLFSSNNVKHMMYFDPANLHCKDKMTVIWCKSAINCVELYKFAKMAASGGRSGTAKKVL